MTVGTTIVDKRRMRSGVCGPGLTGYYSVKTWNGQDQSFTTPRPVSPRKAFLKKLTPHVSRKGRRYYTVEYVENPDWNRVPHEKFDEHPYQMTYDSTMDVSCMIRQTSSSPWLPAFTNLCGWGASLGPWNNWDSNDDNALTAKIKEKILGSDYHAGVFLGELPKALGMIGNAAGRIALAYKHVRRGQWRAAEEALITGIISQRERSYLRDLATNWLELQYGWKPLVNDIQTGAEMLAERFNFPRKAVVRASRRKPGPLTVFPQFVTSDTAYSYWRKSIVCKIEEVDVPQLTGLTDFASVAWELLPWSFIADWILPVGTFLEARGVSQGVKGTFVRSEKREWVVRGLKSTGLPWEHFKYADFYLRKNVFFSRSVGNSLPYTIPAFVPLNKAASWARASNAIALLVQQAKK